MINENADRNWFYAKMKSYSKHYNSADAFNFCERVAIKIDSGISQDEARESAFDDIYLRTGA